MKLRVVDNVYTEFNSEKTFKKMLKKIARKRPVPGLYVVTEPFFEAGIMEIYNYNELLQPYYRKQKRDINILGIAKDKASAREIVCNILEDVQDDMSVSGIRSYFKIGGGL